MNIEERLKDDAARIAGIQPPADLSRRLRTSLEGVPSQTRRWFKPAMAVLTAAMLVVALFPGNSHVPVMEKISVVFPSASEEGKAGVPEKILESDTRGDSDQEGYERANYQKESKPLQDPSPPADPTPPRKPPWGRVGTFSGLTLLAGILWASEFWRRRVALAVVVPLIALIMGNTWLLRDFIF